MSGAGESDTPSVSTSRKRAPADRKVRRRIERLDDGVDQRGIVGREDAERVADRVVDAGAGEIDVDVPGDLLGARAVEPRAREEFAGRRIVARRDRRDRRARRGRHGGTALRRRRRLAELLVERLQHAGGFLAARHAQVQPLFFLRDDEVRIVLAIVAALAAVLLRHRGHHLAPQRLAFGELHALGERHGLVVPRRLAVVGVAERVGGAGHQRGVLLGRERGHARAVERDEAGEEAVQPGALLVRERRGLGNERGDRRRDGLAHSTASASNIAFSASASWRLLKARKVSSSARCAR